MRTLLAMARTAVVALALADTGGKGPFNASAPRNRLLHASAPLAMRQDGGGASRKRRRRRPTPNTKPTRPSALAPPWPR